MLVNISQFPGVFASLFTSGRLVHGTTLLGNRWHMRQDPARANTEWAWRWNCTLRWHRNHFGGCRYAVRNQPPEMPATACDNQNASGSDSVEYTPSLCSPQQIEFCGRSAAGSFKFNNDCSAGCCHCPFASGHDSNGSNWSGCRPVCQ